MKRFKLCALIMAVFIGAFSLFGCNSGSGGGGGGGGEADSLYIPNVTIKVDGERAVSAYFNEELLTAAELLMIEYSTEPADSGNIVVYNGKVRGLLGGTTTTVTALYEGVSAEFDVVVQNATTDKNSGALFDSISVEPIDALSGGKRQDFIMGADISSVAEVLNRGGVFYDAAGNAQSVFAALKNGGVNYIRLRLWNTRTDPDGVDYGGGNNDLQQNIAIAAVAKAMGMKFLLDFHYSDTWADPGKQVIPYDWKDITNSDDMAAAVKDFTKQSMLAFAAENAAPDMVQIGNEIMNGLLSQYPTNKLYKASTITSNRQSAPSEVSGSISANTSNYIMYLKAGIAGAREAIADIQVMIHIDRGGNLSACQAYYDRLETNGVDYDIIGLSYYPFYHGSLSNFRANINNLQSRFPSKKIVIAETSYAFTFASHSNLDAIFSSFNESSAINASNAAMCRDNWDATPQGQANLLRDIINELAALDNEAGLGVFYWEPAWLPVIGAGWAQAGTSSTWANQALFSYDGVVLPSAGVFNLLRG